MHALVMDLLKQHVGNNLGHLQPWCESIFRKLQEEINMLKGMVLSLDGTSQGSDPEVQRKIALMQKQVNEKLHLTSMEMEKMNLNFKQLHGAISKALMQENSTILSLETRIRDLEKLLKAERRREHHQDFHK